MNRFGIYDLAGNVREWCYTNSSRHEHRFILGGGWSDPLYVFVSAGVTQPPFDRSETNGFRCIQYSGSEHHRANLEKAIETQLRDALREPQVSDVTYAHFLKQYDYDKTPLNEKAESMKEEEGWIREKVTFNAAYGNERMMAYLFLPKRGNPPFQVGICFPGSNVLQERSSESLQTPLEFLLKDGRAVMWPIYKSTFERGDSYAAYTPLDTILYKEHVIMWAKDLGRSIDYLETRKDIDSGKIAYLGISWGGALGAIMPAVEPRIKASVIAIGGLFPYPALPEVEQIHYLPRIKTPVLMLGGRHDDFFPYETSQLPFFELLGTPKENKKLVSSELGHNLSQTGLARETLAWLDRYLGPAAK